MKFLFVHSWQGFSLAEWYLREAIDRQCNVDIRFKSIDIPSNSIPANDKLIRILSHWNPEIIGFSCHFWSLSYYLKTADWIKRLNPNAIIVFGGPQVRSWRSAHNILSENEAVDFIIHGPGEEPLCRLLERLVHKLSPASVPGISYREADQTKHTRTVNDLHQRRNLIFHRENRELTRQLSAVQEVSYETVKGCHEQCTYCYYPLDKFNILNDAQVFGELSYLCDLNIPHIRICDTHFGGTKERAKKILRHICTVNNKSSIKIYPDVHHIDEEYIDLIQRSGAQITSIGIQTTNPNALKMIKRQAIHLLHTQIRLMLSVFPWVPADLIIGLPGDSPEGLEKTFRDVLDLGFCTVNIFHLMVFPGTDLAENFSDYFNPEHTTLTHEGQLISSQDFPKNSLEKVSHLIHALEIVGPLPAARKKILDSGKNGSNLFDMACALDPEELLDLHGYILALIRNNHSRQIAETAKYIDRIFDFDTDVAEELKSDLNNMIDGLNEIIQ
jgi:radical SAM superfamily enzyme YgiQ (UPF0313 family)